MLAALSVSPPYAAEIVCSATDKAVVVKVAVRLLPFPVRMPVPRVVAPSLKVTVPEGL